ncbi:MAG: RDD family protein [Ruminococcaceae bacterium]|nr:RDD family protein [Oscillospiraceae bacterium]
MLKFKRIIAWIMDWILSGIPAVVYAWLFWGYTQTHGLHAVGVILFLLFFLSYPTIFVLRDVIFKGRSIAKRILGLYVTDVQTNASPSKSKLILRNLFFVLYPIEAILLLAIDQTLGDMASKTTVVTSREA